MESPDPHPTRRRSLRAVAGAWVAAAIGLAFVLIGLGLTLSAGPTARPGLAAVHYGRVFGLRDAFLGAFTLVLLVAGERRALLLLLVSATALPVADTIALAGPFGLGTAAAANLPFEVPLVLAVALLAGARRRRA